VCVNQVRLLGTTVQMTYRRHEQEWQRRTQHEVVTDLGVLDVLMTLPAGMPIPWSSLSRGERRLLERLPPGVVDRDATTVTRLLVPAVTPLLATVKAPDWDRGGPAASMFAVYCPRMVGLPQAPSDLVLSEASLYGIGVTVSQHGRRTVLVEPEPVVDWQPTPAAWAFSEEIYHQVSGQENSEAQA
jgi:hypothetical protein